MKKSAQNETSAVDASVWQEFLALDPDGHGGVVEELVGVFLTDTQQTIDTIRACAQSGNHTTMKKSAHRLKSSAAGIGALQLSELLSQLEHCNETDKQQLQPRVISIESEFARVRQFLNGALTAIKRAA
jgi:HPt (histidine-containing phosphotransfer) domain-containing protein